MWTCLHAAIQYCSIDTSCGLVYCPMSWLICWQPTVVRDGIAQKVQGPHCQRGPGSPKVRIPLKWKGIQGRKYALIDSTFYMVYMVYEPRKKSWSTKNERTDLKVLNFKSYLEMKDDILQSRNCFHPGPRVMRYGWWGVPDVTRAMCTHLLSGAGHDTVTQASHGPPSAPALVSKEN